MLNKLEWHARQVLRQVGGVGIAGAALLVACLAFQQRILLPMQRHANDIHHETQDLRTNAEAHHLLNAANTPVAQLEEFYRFFPGSNTLTDTLGRVYDAAAKENLMLEQGEYHLAPEHEGKLQRYDLIFPVRGQYAQIRHFIADVLHDSPSVALEGVSFSRSTALDIGVEAQVRMTLYFRADRNG